MASVEHINGEHWSIRVGDVFDGLRTIEGGAVHAVVTSPPYWGLRDYGFDGQIGSEKTPDEFVAKLVSVFAEVRRVLRDDGVLFVNLGDSYAANRSYQVPDSKHVDVGNHSGSKVPRGLQAGDKLGMPWRVALAMQANGWILRQDVIWSKPSPMPESIGGWRWVRCRVKESAACRPRQCGHHSDGREHSVPIDKMPQSEWSDCPGCPKCIANDGMILRKGSWRATTSHEYIFQFVKSQSYFCDGDGSKEPASCAARIPRAGADVYAGSKGMSKDRRDGGLIESISETRNQRSVWRVVSESYKGAHFATYPTDLVRRCLVAATSRGGCCAACGSQYAPVVESKRSATRPGTNSKVNRASDDGDSPYHEHSGSVVGNRDPQRHTTTTVVTGYLPTCRCNAGKARPIVLDPFSGSATTGQVAINMGCDYIGCEGNPEYAQLGVARLETPWVPVAERKKKTVKKKKRRLAEVQTELF